jgi:hypothetical protein
MKTLRPLLADGALAGAGVFANDILIAT